MSNAHEFIPVLRNVPPTWEEHSALHDYMKMYCGFTKEQTIEYAKKHLGPAPSHVTIYRCVSTEIEEDYDE